MIKNCCTNASICSFIETNWAKVICLPALHPTLLVSFPVMAVVSGLTLQWDSSLQHYRPDRTTHCDLQLPLLQGHLDHNHFWILSIRLYIPLCLPYSLALCLSTCFMFAVCLLFCINTYSPFLPHKHAISLFGSSCTHVHALCLEPLMFTVSMLSKCNWIQMHNKWCIFIVNTLLILLRLYF